ncbi:OmpW/AlkL family protein [Microbulbifer magnicolonia]|uniref:OmpW/AlkL family protein n=1 Tax=Microbulbifer magnicolonia TaxID=3109744 RepID=UPI002B407E97|nr:OmpW family outer membrane protein [Microbulbifer sp. GG15]
MTRILAPVTLALTCAAVPIASSAGPAGYEPVPPAPPPPVYQAGTVMARIGLSYIEPNDDSGKWRFNRDLFPDLDGLRFDIDHETTWNVTLGFMPVDHFSVEVGYIGESEHDLDLTGLMSPFENDRIRTGSIDRQTGTLIFNWFPVCKESWIQPYIGLGGQYTDFDGIRFSVDANDYLAEVANAIGPATMFIDDDWGWAGQVGIDIMFGRNSRWFVNAAAQYLDLSLDVDLHYAVPVEFDPGVTISAAVTDVDFDPWVYNLGIGYRF